MDHTSFTGDGFRAFRDIDRPGPIHMLNLVALRDVAQYPDDHANADKTITGKEAYAAYGRETGHIFAGLGGKIIWRGKMELMLIGPEDKHWDICFIAQYPDVAAFLSMIKDPEYRVASAHRQAAVRDSRLIRMNPGSEGDNFGE